MDGEVIPPGLPALTDARTGIFDGTDGLRNSANKAFRSGQLVDFGMMGSGFSHGATNGFIAANRLAQHRDGPMAAAVATQMVNRFPVLAAIVEALVVSALGPGLVLSSKIDHTAIGCTAEEAQALSRTIERRWARWCSNPVECDAAGRSTFHQIAHAAYRGAILAGEILVIQEARRVRGASTLLKVKLLDPMQLDRTWNRDGEGFTTYQGVHFLRSGEIAGYWVRDFAPGSQYVNVSPQFIRARMTFGRRNVLHIFDYAAAGQVRGLSMLTSALTDILEGQQLQEYTLEKSRLQTAYALTITSAEQTALQGMTPKAMAEREMERAAFYEVNPFDPKAGTAAKLAPGDKLEFLESKTPNNNYQSFSESMDRRAARASGANPEHVSGNYKDSNFASSRLAEEVPYRQTLRRREAILRPLYHETYRNFLAEQIDGGYIKLPAGAPPFWQAPDDYAEAKWMGPGRITADPYKATQNSVLRVANHLSTLADEMAEDGRDLETTLRERAEEIALAKKLGLPPGMPGVETTVHRDNADVPPGEQD